MNGFSVYRYRDIAWNDTIAIVGVPEHRIGGVHRRELPCEVA